MAQSPLEAADPSDIASYLNNWRALSSMLTRGRSFSGFERHCCFLNTGVGADRMPGRFADVSAASGLDLIDDGRAVAVVDWDHDGDLDFWVTNRGAPRLRLLLNNLPRTQATSSVALTLEGTACNRDAIGAVLELTIGGRKHTRVLRAGESFMSQSSKRIHFGLGALPSGQNGRLIVRWPGAESESFEKIEAGAHYHLVQGSGVGVRKPPGEAKLASGSIEIPDPTERARIILTERPAAPVLDYVNFQGELQRYDPNATGGAPILINLWASWCAPCLTELNDFAEHFDQLKARGLRILALTTEAVSEDGTRPDVKPAKRFVKKSKFPFEIGATDANGLRLLTVLHNQSFVRERPLPLPTSFLIDKHGNLAAIYKGPVKGAQLLADIDLLDAAPAAVVESAFPFPSRDGLELFPLAVLDFAKAYQEGGYIDDARRQARKAIDAKPTGNVAVDAANRARAWYYLGTLEQSQRNWKEAAQAYRLTIEFSPGQPLLEVALGVVLWQGGEQEAAEHSFTKALAAKPDDLQILHALGKAHLQLDRAPDAVRYLEKALALKPDNLTLALALALAFDMAGNTRAAISNYREILKAHPDSLDSKNNLAWILATCSDATMRDGETALALATEVNQTTKFNNPSTLNTLAAAQGESGDLSAAIKTMERAIDIARAIGRDSLVSKLRARRTQYTSKLHESSPPKE